MFDHIRDLALTRIVMDATKHIPNMEAARASLGTVDDKTVALAAALLVMRFAEKESKVLIDSADPGNEIATEVIASLVTSIAALLDIAELGDKELWEKEENMAHCPADCPICTETEAILESLEGDNFGNEENF